MSPANLRPKGMPENRLYIPIFNRLYLTIKVFFAKHIGMDSAMALKKYYKKVLQTLLFLYHFVSVEMTA